MMKLEIFSSSYQTLFFCLRSILLFSALFLSIDAVVVIRSTRFPTRPEHLTFKNINYSKFDVHVTVHR